MTFQSTAHYGGNEIFFQCLTSIHVQVLIRKVHDMILDAGRREQTIWFSLSENINADLRAYDPSIPNISSVLGMLKVNRQFCVCLSLSLSFSPFAARLFLYIPSSRLSLASLSKTPLPFSPLLTKHSASYSTIRASCLLSAWTQISLASRSTT